MMKYINKLPELVALIVSLIIIILSIGNSVDINTISYRILICAPICYLLGMTLKYYIKFTYEQDQKIQEEYIYNDENENDNDNENSHQDIEQNNANEDSKKDHNDVQDEFTPFQVENIEKVDKNN